MKSKTKLALVIVVITMLGAGGYAAWHAWDKGLIGDNPRAPTPQAMDKAVRIQAAYTAITTGARIPCFNIDGSLSRAEIKNVPGIGSQSAPGQHAVTMLLQTNTRDQQSRDAHLAQIGYMAKQGLFATADVAITTDDGVERPAKSFRLTWKGYAEKMPGYSGSLCLNYGKREFAGIETIEKSVEQMMGLDVYEVTYKTTVKDIPAWAATEEAKRHFPKLIELTGDNTGKAKVLRTKEGWRSAYEIEAEMAVVSKGGNPAQIAGMYLQGLKQQFEAKPIISLEEANHLASQYLTDPDRYSNAGIACFPLHLQRGGDEKEAQGARDAAEFAVTYYDKDRKSYEYQTMARALHVLSALEGAGLAEMEVIRPTPIPSLKAGRRASLQPAEPPKPAGVRFKVSREAMTAMGMSGYGGGCIPAGRTKYEVLAVRDSYDNAQSSAIVRAVIDQTPEWALKVAELLPSLKAIIENGMPMHGTIYRMADGSGTGKWKLSGLNPMYPTLHYESIPTHLKPLMPLTAASFTSKPVKAPALVPELRSPRPALRVEDYEQAMPAPAAPAAPPADSYQPVPQPYKPALPPPPKKTSAGPLYPADGSPVHVISIYQSLLPGGAKRGFQQHPEGAASVKVSDDNATLLLFSNEPTEWRVNVVSDVKLKRVVAVGSSDQRIVLSGGGKPEVTATKKTLIAEQAGIDTRSMEIPLKQDPNSLVSIAAITQNLTGAMPSSYQSSYEAPSTGFVIDANTPKFALAAPLAPGAMPSRIVLRAMFKEMIDGHVANRGRAGAYNEAWSEQRYSAGKVYFEGKARVAGSLSMHGYANIGMCPARESGVETHFWMTALALADNEQRLYKDGDLFGVAADFDKQFAYFRVNGKWLTGAPGSGSGKRLQKGKEYSACVMTSGTTMGGSDDGKQSNTGWELNFGNKPFAYQLPSGFRPYQGGEAL